MRTNTLSPSIVLAASLLAAPTAWASPQLADRVELSGQAMCNDGEPAVFYFRAGTGQNRSKYLIVLSGGGYCGGDLGCAVRWNDLTGAPDGIIGWHGNMVPDTNQTKNFEGRGILDFDGVPAANPFDGYSRIYVPYCSSDVWAGTGEITEVDRYQDVDGDGVLDDLFPPVLGDTLPEQNGVVELYFGGSKIIEGVIDRVLQGYNDDPATIPTEIVLVGSSAGGAGVNINLDLVADQVAMATNGAEDAYVYGISDSANELGIFANNVPDQRVADDLRQRYEYYSGGPGSLVNVAVDQSCIDVEIGAAEQKCYYSPYVLANHVQTPIFLTGNAYDAVGHGYIYEDLTCVTYPLSSSFVNGCQNAAQATQWIRDRISNVGAPQLSSSPYAGPSGYYIANFGHGYHELSKQSSTFFGSTSTAVEMNAIDSLFGIGPRLGGGVNDDRSLESTAACFRDKVVYGNGGLACEHEVRSTNI
jgi:hypothetical protein